VSTALLVAVKNAFHHYRHLHADEYQVPLFSPQCIINGLPSHTFPNEIKMEKDEEGVERNFYRSSTFLALSFIVKRGISRDIAYPFEGQYPDIGYLGIDRDFERGAEIYRPFKVPVNIFSASIRHILEQHGPIIGIFYCSDTIFDYTRVSNSSLYKSERILHYTSKNLCILLTHFFSLATFYLQRGKKSHYKQA
jgi:hypothetical protein